MIVVVGGGVAGCAAAFRLTRSGRPVVLLEASDALGGRARTELVGDFRVESGAIYCLNSYGRTLAMLAEAGAGELMQPWSPRAGLFDGSRLHEVRYDFLPTYLRVPLLSSTDKLRLVAQAARMALAKAPEPFETDSLAEYDDGEDLETWARRSLGDAGFEYVIRPLIEPTFGVDAREISTPYLRGVMKRALLARFFRPRGGMSRVCEALTRDVDVRLGVAASSVSASSVTLADGTVLEADGVVVATDAVVAASLLADDVPPPLLEGLRGAPYSSMAHVTQLWDHDPWPGRRTEMLLPVGPGARPILGIITRTDEMVPSGARSADHYFSSTATRAMSDDELVAEATATMARMWDAAPASRTVVFRRERALAICPPGHYRRMRALRRAVPDGIALAGDYLAHLGVETAVISGDRAASRLLA